MSSYFYVILQGNQQSEWKCHFYSTYQSFYLTTYHIDPLTRRTKIHTCIHFCVDIKCLILIFSNKVLNCVSPVHSKIYKYFVWVFKSSEKICTCISSCSISFHLFRLRKPNSKDRLGQSNNLSLCHIWNSLATPLHGQCGWSIGYKLSTVLPHFESVSLSLKHKNKRKKSNYTYKTELLESIPTNYTRVQ